MCTVAPPIRARNGISHILIVFPVFLIFWIFSVFDHKKFQQCCDLDYLAGSDDHVTSTFRYCQFFFSFLFRLNDDLNGLNWLNGLLNVHG